VASVEKRKPRTPGGATTYRVRFRDPAGVEKSKTFPTSSKAKTFAATVEADKVRGSYVDQDTHSSTGVSARSRSDEPGLRR
jgi:hypothetical protein